MKDPVLVARNKEEKAMEDECGLRFNRAYTPQAAKFLNIKAKSYELINTKLWPPYSDHAAFVKKDGEPFAWISQPYPLGDIQIREILDWAYAHNLRVSIQGWSYHYPNRTMTISFSRKVNSIL